MSKQGSEGSVLGGALLIAGTTIGGGMLALPVLTSLTGFIPASLVYLLCWLFMLSTGLLFLEVSQWIKEEANIISMAEQTLGKPGKYGAWVVYLFLFYCLTIAYIVGCGNILVEFLGFSIPDWMGPLVFVALFLPLILVKTSIASKVNGVLVAGLALSYFAFVFLGFKHVDTTLLRESNWSKSMMILPIAFASFAYQGIIPTLVSYMNQDIKRARKAILIGSFIPLITYIIWQWLILGIVPIEGPNGLAEALKTGTNAVYPLKNFIESASVYYIGQAFAFFALVTSCLGVTLGLRDFLADGLKIQKDFWGKVFLSCLVFFIPLLIAVFYPHIFLLALQYAGGFGCALLLGLLPIAMVWVGRYHLGFQESPQLGGGKWTLGLLGAFVLFEIVSELQHLINS